MDPTVQVEFYILESQGLAAQLHFACRLTEKAYGLGNAVYAHAPSIEVAQQLDQMLWSFRQGSFIPHEVVGTSAPRAPVLIGLPEQAPAQGDVLINLCATAPSCARGFRRVAEIVPGDAASREAGRQRFRSYRELGLEPQTHRIS